MGGGGTLPVWLIGARLITSLQKVIHWGVGKAGHKGPANGSIILSKIILSGQQEGAGEGMFTQCLNSQEDHPVTIMCP